MILISYLNDRFSKVIVDLITRVKIAAVMAQKEFLMKILFRKNWTDSMDTELFHLALS